MKDFIKKEFDMVCMPDDCAEKICQTITQTPPLQRKKLRTLPRILIAATLSICLLLSVAAVGYQKGWLDDFLGRSENAEDVKELQLTANDGNMEVTLERMLIDGPFVYLQVSVRTQGDENAAEAFEGNPLLPESGIRWRLDTTFADGNLFLPLSEQEQQISDMEELSSEGPSRVWYTSRLDDGSDPNFASYTMQIILADLPADYEGLKLNLRLNKYRTWTALEDGGYTTDEEEFAIIEERIVLSDAKARVTTMEDGRQVKVHSLGVQIQGADYPLYNSQDEWISGVVMKDGTRLPFKPGWTAQDYFEEDMQWHICLLNEIIDPNEVDAIYAGDTIYPLK